MEMVLETDELESIENTAELSDGLMGLLDRMRKAYQMRAKGVPVENIASAFGISIATAYRWFKKFEQRHANLMLKSQRTDLLFDRLRYAEIVRDLAMAEVHRIDVEGVSLDPSGKVTQGKLDPKLRGVKVKALSLALTADASIFRMLSSTGVLPSVAREIHNTLADTDPAERVLRVSEHRTDAEIERSVQQLLQNTRAIAVDIPDTAEVEFVG